ncbi:MAG: hypothetical protein H0U69_04875 [Trueperaceae bacterium]|nr:hypothetical protein [Trueperaceae bacterium]
MLRTACCTLLIALTSIAASQVTPDAAERLICARDAIGPQATELLSSSRILGVVTYFGPGGAVAAAFDVEAIVDLRGERALSIFRMDGVPVIVQGLTPDDAYMVTPDTGAIDLPPSLRAEARQAFVAGSVGLLRGALRDSASVVGTETWEGVTGTRLDLVTNGIATSILLGDDCTLVAERTPNAQLGEVTTIYTDVRVVDGLALAFVGDLSVQGSAFARLVTTDIELGATFGDDTFARP